MLLLAPPRLLCIVRPGELSLSQAPSIASPLASRLPKSLQLSSTPVTSHGRPPHACLLTPPTL